VVEGWVIGHTPAMKMSINPLVSRLKTQRSRWIRWAGAGRYWWVFLTAALSLANGAMAERDQTAIKASATTQIQNAAASAFQTPADSVEVRLGDKRLVLPDCQSDFAVSFPFNDRATTQLECSDPAWRGFVQIRLGTGISVFRYVMPLEEGEVLKRSHVARHMVSADGAQAGPVVVLDDVLDFAMGQPVEAGEIVLLSHFDGASARGEFSAPAAEPQGAWVAQHIIPRGNRLSRESFSWETVEGRAPTDLLSAQAEFPMFEALRDIMPGDKLRRSTVKMAPSVRKNEEIEVSLVRGSLTVTNVVRMSRDATIGESIDVINVESGRILKARVTGIGQVELL